MVISRTPIENGIDFFSKSLTRIPVTETISNLSGEREYTDGTAVTIRGALFRQEDVRDTDKIGAFNGADAILLIKTSVTCNIYDKITYNGETFRVHKNPVTRTLGDSQIYNRYDLVRL